MNGLRLAALAAATGLTLMIGAAAPQQADAQVRLQLGDQGDYWNRYWNWYDGRYRPYYTQRYRDGWRDDSRYRDGRFDDDYARRYGDRRYGYGDRRDYRGYRGRDIDRYRDLDRRRFDDGRMYRGYRGGRDSGGIDLGPLQLRWR